MKKVKDLIVLFRQGLVCPRHSHNFMSIILLLMMFIGGNVSAWAEVYTLSMNDGAVQTPQTEPAYFTVTGGSFNNKYTGTYKETTYTKGWKVESTSSISFACDKNTTLTIVQSLSACTDGYPKIIADGFSKTCSSTDRNEDKTNNIGVYTIDLPQAGIYTITRTGEYGILFVQVETDDTGTIKTKNGNETNWDFTAITPAQAENMTTPAMGQWGRHETDSKLDYVTNPSVEVATYWSPTWCNGIQIGLNQKADNTKARIYVNHNNGYYLGGAAASIKVTIPSGANSLTITSTNAIASNPNLSFSKDGNKYTATVNEGDIIEIHRSENTATYISQVSTSYVEPPAGPTANFVYGQTSFPEEEQISITLPAHKAGQTINVTVTPEDGANVEEVTNGSYSGSTLSFTAPAAGSNMTVTLPITKNGVTTEYTISISTETKVGQTFDPEKRYSQVLIDARKDDFKSNTNSGGLGYTGKNNNLDYVPGLVAKSIIEAVDYYKDHKTATIDDTKLQTWFNAVKTYGNLAITDNGKAGKSFDDLNAVKIYFGLKDVAASGKITGITADNDTWNEKLGLALTGIKNASTTYAISSSHSTYPISIADMQGGLWHKADYINQMWGDGQYMGTAFLAQLINDADVYDAGNESKRVTANDWDFVAKQINIYHTYAWDNTYKLPHHAFAADKGTNSTSHSDTWKLDGTTYHNEGIWARATGWYFMALVDILEQMQKANVTGANYNTVKNALDAVAAGVKARQDAATGLWYQLPIFDETFSNADYNSTGALPGRKYNYLESSASALFTAAYLKAMRLGLLDRGTYEATAKKAYQGFIENFIDANNNIYWSCRSAGLGGSGEAYKAGGTKFRDGSNAYYLKGNDVAAVRPDENLTEGKALGAFIMAAVEYERAYLEPAASNDATLSDIRLKEGTLTPTFNKDVHLYTVNTKCDPKWLDESYVTKSDPNASVNFSNNAGKGTQTITVTAADGTTTEEYHLVFLAPNNWNETFTSASYNESSQQTVALKSDESIVNNKLTMNTVKINTASVNQRFVVQNGTSWLYDNGKNFYNYNSGGRDFGILNCKKNQIIEITATAGSDGINIVPTNATLKNSENNVYTYTVNTEGNVRFNITRYTHLQSITINDPEKVTFTATASEHGSIAITADGVAITSGSEVEVGAKIVVTATPDANYETVWTKTAGNAGEEGVNTYTINSITEATTISATFNEVSAGETTTLYSYTISTEQNTAGTAYTATGGTATLGAAKVEANGFKSDNGMNSNKYVKVSLNGNTLQAGDKIIVNAFSGSNGSGIYIATVNNADGIPVGTVGANYVDAGSVKKGTKDLVYIVKVGDPLVGLSDIYLFRNGETASTGVSTYIKSITIQRTTGGGSKADSPLDITGTAYINAGNGWTPVVGGTIALTDIISSQSTGAYSITAGDAATLENGVLTAVKNGTITLTQAADETFKAGKEDINVRIAENGIYDVATISLSAGAVVSDNATVRIKGITMTYGNDNFWSLGVTDSHGSYTGGQKNPAVTNNIPTSGTYYKFEPTKNGTLTIDTKIGASKPIYVSEDGTLIAATANNTTVGNGETLNDNYSGNLVFDVKAGKTYYYYLMGSKAGLYGFSFADAVTITTQPVQPEAYIQNAEVTPLTVVATPSSASGTISYQWYSCNEDGTNAQAVADATNASFTPSTTSVGTTYYYCVVTESGKTDKSNIISIAVSKAFTNPVFTPADDSTITVGSNINVTWENGMTFYARWSGSASNSWTAADFTDQHKVGSTGTGKLSRSQTGDQYVYYILKDETTGATSEVGKIHYVIQNQQPTVTNPVSRSVLIGEVVTLTVEGGNGADSYQWYVCDDDNKANGTEISGATLASYAPSTNTIGTKYYYCKAINSKFTDDPSGTRNFKESDVATVIVTDKVGNDDKTTKFLGDIKGDKILYPGSSVNYKFVNTNGNGTDKYKNFVIAIKGVNDKTNQVNLRADGIAHYYDTEHRWTGDGFSINPSDAITSDDFNTEMNGVSVDVTVTYSPEKKLVMTANIITSTGKVWTYKFDSSNSIFNYTADYITTALSVDHAQLTMQDNASDLNVQEAALVPNGESITIPYATSSNGEVTVTTNKSNLTASVNPTTKEITLTSEGDATGMVGVTVWQKNGTGTTDIVDESGNKTGEETQTYLAGVKSMLVTITKNENNDVSLATLTVNGQSVEVLADKTEYTAKSPSKVVPTITATATNTTAEVNITQAIVVDGTATITVSTSGARKTYTVKFSPSAETPKDKVHWVLDGKAQVNNDYNKIQEYAADTQGNIYQMIHKGANGDYYGSFLYIGGETSNVNREISFKGISGKGRIVINTRKSSDTKVGSTIQVKDGFGNVVATGTYQNQTACNTTIFTYDANQTYTININGRAYILSMDYVPCREDILYVEENGQRYNLTKENEAEDDYFTGKSSSWSEIKIDGTKYNLFNLSGSSRSFTINANGAMAFEILTQNNSSSERTYKVSVNGTEVAKSPFTANKNSLTSTGLIMTGNTGDITITVSNGSGSVYPYQIIFYAEEPEASLNTSDVTTKVGKDLNIALSTASDGVITMNNDINAAIATATFDADNNVLTIHGVALGNTQVTFNVSGGNGYKDAVATINVNVEKQVLTLKYSPESYNYNVDTEEETGTLSPTLTVKDEDGNIVPLSDLNIQYESDDESIATVTPAGVITKRGTGQGSADIIAKIPEDGTYKSAFGIFSVIIEQGRSMKIDDNYDFGDGATTPSVGQTLTLTASDNETPLVYATFGGWKWGTNGDKDDHKYVVDGSTKSDGWAAPIKYTGSGGTRPTYVDGYSYASSGKTDAMDETKNPSDGAIFGKTRNGWFKSESTDPHVKPFTLPVRGAYLKFEPQENGMLSVYILQNGAFNSTTQSDGTSKIIPGEFQPHSFHVVDHNGTAVPLYTDFKFVVKEPVTQMVNGRSVECNYTGQTEPGEYKEWDVATWPMFYTNYTAEERQAIKDAWASGKNGAQQVVKLHDQSFFITQKAYVKYTFYVASSQTYYLFSNFSKIGFAGMNFIPDADQPDQEHDILALNETENFPTLKNASENVSSELSVPQYGKITVDRTDINADRWTTICLPFDMTEREVEENFGIGTQLVMFDGTEDNGSTHTLHFVYHEIQTILAGYPYMIKPKKSISQIVVRNKLIQPKNNGTPSSPVLNYGLPKDMVTFSSNRYWTGTPYITELSEANYNYTMKGTYGGSTTITKGDIYVSKTDGSFKRLTAESTGLKGYRAYLRSNKPELNRTKSLTVFFSGNLEQDELIDGTTTYIFDVMDSEDEYQNNYLTPVMGIYNLNGQKVDCDVRNLPKGMYIINGKKMYVK